MSTNQHPCRTSPEKHPGKPPRKQRTGFCLSVFKFNPSAFLHLIVVSPWSETTPVDRRGASAALWLLLLMDLGQGEDGWDISWHRPGSTRQALSGRVSFLQFVTVGQDFWWKTSVPARLDIPKLGGQLFLARHPKTWLVAKFSWLHIPKCDWFSGFSWLRVIGSAEFLGWAWWGF